MERRLIKPFEPEQTDVAAEPVVQLKDRTAFSDPIDWVIYEAKVFYEVFGDIDSALATLERGHAEHPANMDITLCMAECCSRRPEQHARAVELCQKVLSQGPEGDCAYTILARVHAAAGQIVASYVAAMRALKLNSHNYEAGVYLGTMGFSIALAEGNAHEMACSLENLRLTQQHHPGGSRLAAIIAGHEQLLDQFNRGMDTHE